MNSDKKTHPECGEGITGNVEGRHLDIIEAVPKVLVIQQNFGKWFMAYAFS